MHLGLGLRLQASGKAPLAVPYQLGVELDLDPYFGITIATGVSAWVDQAGANDVTQGTGANQPAFAATDPFFRGHPSLGFDGTNDCLISATGAAIATGIAGASQTWTFAIVHRRAVKPTATHTFFSFGREADASPDPRLAFKSMVLGSVGASAAVMTDDAVASDTWSAAEAFDYGPCCSIFTSAGTRARHYLIGMNGSNGRGMGGNLRYDADVDIFAAGAADAPGTFSFDKFGIGCGVRQSSNNEFWSGSIARVLGWSRELTAAERVRLASYLANRYLPLCLSPA